MNLTTAETFEIHFIKSLICSLSKLQRVKITQKVPFTFEFLAQIVQISKDEMIDMYAKDIHG